MSQFFKNFPLITYNFGDEVTPSLYQNLSVYIKLIDEIKDDIAFYTTLFIQDYDRPDSLSFKLYDTTQNFIGHFIILILIYVKADGHYLIKIITKSKERLSTSSSHNNRQIYLKHFYQVIL